MIVTIDGPAGAGKSSAARGLARKLGFRFLDTGAMYRAVAWAAIERSVPLDDEQALAALARQIDIRLDGERVYVDGRDVTQPIRTLQVTSAVQFPAGNTQVRHHLVDMQRQFAASHDVVTEGRDQGTVAFPDAECKLYITATPEERARRRVAELQARGESVTLEEVLRQQNERDERDTSRQVGPLSAAADAIEVYTDGMTEEEVIDHLERLVRGRMPGK